MAHMVDRMMYSGLVPWHGLGDYQKEITFEDARKVLCNVSERPITFMSADNGDVPVEGYKAIVRDDTGAALCVQKESYGTLQYIDQLDVLNAAAGDGALRLKTVGLLDSGRQAFALADIPSAQFEVAGSVVLPYLLMSTSHDCSRLLRYLFTGTYVVCANTVAAALHNAGIGAKTRYIPNVIQIKHTSRAYERVTVAKELVAQARAYFGTFNEVALRLVNQRISFADMTRLTAQLFPITDAQAETFKKYGEESSSHKAQAKVLRLFSGDQRARENAPGTKWAAYNAVTEYIDHHTAPRGQTARAVAESRFQRIMFESGAKVREEALSLLLAA